MVSDSRIASPAVMTTQVPITNSGTGVRLGLRTQQQERQRRNYHFNNHTSSLACARRVRFFLFVVVVIIIIIIILPVFITILLLARHEPPEVYLWRARWSSFVYVRVPGRGRNDRAREIAAAADVRACSGGPRELQTTTTAMMMMMMIINIYNSVGCGNDDRVSRVVCAMGRERGGFARAGVNEQSARWPRPPCAPSLHCEFRSVFFSLLLLLLL